MPRYASGTEEGSRSEEAEPIRPEFPPPNLGYVPLFPEELPEDLGSNILCGWNFLNKFRDLLGVPFMTFDDLLQALIDGDKSCALAELHMSMMRVVQADMEEAHATGAMQVQFFYLNLPSFSYICFLFSLNILLWSHEHKAPSCHVVYCKNEVFIWVSASHILSYICF